MMTTTLNKMLKKADEIGDYYAYLQQQMFYLLIDTFKTTRPELVDKEHILEWRLKALAKMGALTKKIIALISKETGKSEKYINDLIKKDGLTVAKQMNKQLAKDLNKPLVNVSADTIAIIDSYAHQTFRDVDNYVNQTLLTTNYKNNPALKAYQQTIDNTVLDVVTGRKTTDQALKDNIYKSYEQGMDSSFIDEGGHTWSIEGYTRTVIKSTASRVFNDARIQSMKDFDSVLATMTSHPAARPACAPIQGKIVNIVPRSDSRFNKKYPTIYDHDYGKPAGTLGINCRHMLYPYIEGVSHNFQKQYDPKKAVENAKIQQKQRYYERSVRKWKNEKLLAERIGDSKRVAYCKTKISAYQKNLRIITKKHSFLNRQYARERIIPNMKEVNSRAASVRLTQNKDKQARHILGTKEYEQAVKNRNIKPSYFTISAKELDVIIQKKAHRSEAFQPFQYINAGKTIGIYKDKGGNLAKTTRMKVMQSKTGYHAVPAVPRELLNNGKKNNKNSR